MLRRRKLNQVKRNFRLKNKKQLYFQNSTFSNQNKIQKQTNKQNKINQYFRTIKYINSERNSLT